MTFEQRRDLAQRLRTIPLERVLPLCGGQPDRDDRHKWHTPAGTLSVTGAKFMNWTSGRGGGGAIDLVIHLRRLDFKGAVDWLAGHFAGAPATGTHATPAASHSATAAPQAGPRPTGTRARLPDRSTAPALRRWWPRSSTPAPSMPMPEPTPSSFCAPNTKFPSALNFAGTTPRGLARLGSRLPQRPGLFRHSRPTHRPTVVLCESAIDAISCFALHPGYRCLSTAGARPNPLWLRPFLDQGCQVYCGFDADPTGDAMAAAMIALHPAVQRLRPSQHDWNDILRPQD